MSLASIQEAVLSLPENDRAKLIDVLWDSLASPSRKVRESAWAEESQKRIDAYDKGLLKARDASSVFDDLRDNLRK